MGKTLQRQRRKVQLLQTTFGKSPAAFDDKGKAVVDVNRCVVKIHAALSRRHWTKAVDLLQTMLISKRSPKLGTLMRWVRLADATGHPTTTATLLYWILRVVGWKPKPCDEEGASWKESIYSIPPWSPDVAEEEKGHEPTQVFTIKDFIDKHLPILTLDPKDPKDPKEADWIRTYPKDVVRLEKERTWATEVKRFDIPFLPGGFLLKNVLSLGECQQLMCAVEAMGFRTEIDYSFNGELSTTIANQSSARLHHRPAEGCVWLADPSLVQTLYERVAFHLPAQLDGRQLAGINSRWRFYRYAEGTLYRPHLDGSWPGSGLDAEGRYLFDAYQDRWSCLTFLLYLNDDFEGGATTYYFPSLKEGHLNAYGVQPSTGSVLCFPHGTIEAALHEGSPVTRGTKYVMRSDVLYYYQR